MSTIKADITLSPDLEKTLRKSDASLMDVATVIVAGGTAAFAVLLAIAHLLKIILLYQKPADQPSKQP